MASPSSKPIVAVFDFDGTLTHVDSFLPFLREVAGPVKFWGGLICLSPALVAHAVGFIPNWRLKEKFVGFFLRGQTPVSLRPAIGRFCHGRLQTLFNPRAVEKLRWHRENDHRLMVLSASPELYLSAWGKSANISEVLGTRLAMANGAITGNLDGQNCHGEEKIARLQAALGDLAAYEIYAYGDSRSDLPLLNLTEHPGYRSFDDGRGLSFRLKSVVRLLKALL